MTVPPRLAKCYLRTSPFLCCCVKSYSLNKVEGENSTKNIQTKKMFGAPKKRKEKQKQKKSNRLKSSFYFSLWAIKAQKLFCPCTCFLLSCTNRATMTLPI